MSDHEKVLSAACPCGSGKMLRDCHGTIATASTTPSPGASSSGDNARSGDSTSLAVVVDDGTGVYEVNEPGPHPEVAISRPPVTRKLDLAAGQSLREGFEGVDIWPGAQHVVDLQRYPWPFEDESVLELHCSHYIEHIPMKLVRRPCARCQGLGALHPALGHEVDGIVICPVCCGVGGEAKDALFAFFDECYRILVPDGWMTVIVPAHRSDRAFQDPTHRRFIASQTFAYMNEDWRRTNRLDHYNVDCNFIGNVDPIVDQALAMRHPDVAQQRMQRDWNTVIDWQAKMQKKPRLPRMVAP